MTVEDVLSAELEVMRRVPTAVAGEPRYADGVVTTIRPGVVMLSPDGWSGLWEVDETVRKTYAVVKTDASVSS